MTTAEFLAVIVARLDDAAIATVEDTILAKLERADASDSARQLRDVAAMIRIHGGELDLVYLRRWADDLNVRVALEAALADPGLR